MLWQGADWAFIYRPPYFNTKKYYKKTSQDFIDYCNDLNNIAEGCLDNSYQSGYSYTELLDEAIQDNAEFLNRLQQSDCCIVVYSAYDYDPFFSDPCTYLKDRYDIKADFFDITDQDSLCILHAIRLSHLFFQSKKYQRITLIALEQTALPLRKNKYTPVPPYSGVSALCTGYPYFISHNEIFDNLEKALAFCEHFFHIKTIQCLVLHRSPLKHLPALPLPNFDIQFHLISVGVLPIFNYLINHFQNNIHVVCIEGEAMNEWGILISSS